jgi:hypothetical protein
MLAAMPSSPRATGRLGSCRMIALKEPTTTIDTKKSLTKRWNTAPRSAARFTAAVKPTGKLMAMPKPFRFRIQDKDGEGPDVEGEFSDDEWRLLQSFAHFVDELADTAVGNRGLDYGMTIAWSAETGWAPVDTSRLPSKTELREFLHVFRPILLEGEPTYFMKVANIIARRAPHKGWRALREQFEGTRFEKMVTISVLPSATASQPTAASIVLNSGKTLKKWLNAFEYHHDANLAAEFNEIHAEDFPTPDHTKGLMLELLREKAVAAVKLREIIRTFQRGKGASFTMRY